MARSALRSAPSSYNTLSYNLVQLVFFVSSIVVAGITLFFIWHLRHDGWPLPWTFIVTAAISLLTAFGILLRVLVHFCHSPNSTHQVIVSYLVLVGWAFSFGLLTWNARATLTTACDTGRWGIEGRGGHLVCRIYKAQYAFAVFAFICALTISVMDQQVRRRLGRLGAYNRMEDQQYHGLDGKGLQSHDDPWSMDGATELHGHSKPSRAGAGGTADYQSLDGSRHDDRGGYAELDDGIGNGAGYGQDTGYRGRDHL